MRGALTNYLISWDALGDKISLNYKGDGSYKTGFGAFSTIGIKAFVMTYAIVQILSISNYESPAITQYEVYEPRTDGASLNLEENLASMAFVLNERKTGKPVRPDPRFIKVGLQLSRTADTESIEAIDLIETTYANPDANPEYFLKGSYTALEYETFGSNFMQIIADRSKVNLVNNQYVSIDSQYLTYRIAPCDSANSEEVKCASKREIESYIDELTITLYTLRNFVDY